MLMDSSPVVYWTSKWIETGNIIEVEKNNGKKELIPELVLVGERNPDYNPRK